MAKSRKKNNSVAVKQKLNTAQYKVEVMSKLRDLCVLIDEGGSASLFNVLPQTYKDEVFNIRGTFRVTSSEGKKIQRRLAEVLEKGLREQMKRETIEVIKGSGRYVSLYNFMLVGVPLAMLLQEDHYFKHKTLLEPFYNDDVFERFSLEMEKHISLYCLFYSDLRRNILYDFWTEVRQYRSGYCSADAINNCRFGLHIVIEPVEVDVKSFKIQNETHLGTALCCFYYHIRQDNVSGMVHASVASKDLEPNSIAGDSRIPVYIQQHVIDSIMEHASCPFPLWTFPNLVKAMLTPKIIRLTTNKFLFEYCLENVKIGYLAVHKIAGALLIRSFLFITNNGTPEGRKLEELIVQHKEDKKYLAIDNLQDLANAGVEQNKTVNNIFIKAGLTPVLKFCKRIRDFNINFLWLIDYRSRQAGAINRLTTEYLKPGADNDELVEIVDTDE
ncbi:MAG: hypothetical protein LBR10_00535 [Prevotellaceae bacterium]|jgi:hypothetical protein|nr:hypothetical protein [Prevotellaceae bacterium]